MASLRDGIEFIAVLTLMGSLILFTPLWGPRVVYGRCFERVSYADARTFRFSLRDIGCLFVYIAVANSGFRLIQHEYQFFPVLSTVMPVMGNSLAILTWILAIRFADSWNVVKPFARVVAIIIYFPLSAVSVAQVLMSCMMLMSGLESFSEGFASGVVRYVHSPSTLTACGILIFASMLVYFLRRTWRMVLVNQVDQTESPEYPT